MVMTQQRISNAKSNNEVWLLPHPDDELFGFDPLNQSKEEINVFYFTKWTSKRRGSKQVDRELEAISAWRVINKRKVNIFSSMCKFEDGKIYRQFDLYDFRKLAKEIRELNPTILVSPSFEGGHQDHDYVFAITRVISEFLQIPHYDFPTYRARNKSRFMFTLQNSYDDQKIISNKSIKSKFLSILVLGKMAQKYKSQKKSLLILFPAIATSILLNKRQLKIAKQKFAYESKTFYELRKKANPREVLEFIEKLEEFKIER
jgi:LmbE family N-acetylglucosaminyl deacetylase